MKNIFDKKSSGKGKGVVKGRSSGLVISLIIHAVAFVIAGALVVFEVMNKEEVDFVPPEPVKRPPMNLQKPKVRMKSKSNPKTPARILSPKKIGTPDLALPDMGGGAELFAGADIGGLDLNLEPGSKLSLMGAKDSMGSELIGTFYDLKRDREGDYKGLDAAEFRSLMIDFFDAEWNLSVFRKYFRSERKLYASSLLVPPVQSGIVPVAFGDEDADGIYWVVHYKGQLVHKDGITFRFWASADETMAVRVDGKWVVGARYASPDGQDNFAPDPDPVVDFWNKSNRNNRRFVYGNSLAYVGDWITLEPGIPQDIEILIGDNGGSGAFMLMVEEKDAEYPRGLNGGPLLPVFKTQEFARDMLDVIYRNLPEGQVSLTNGPVFNDFGSSGPETIVPVIDEAEMEAEITPVEPSPSDAGEPELRSWNINGTDAVAAEFVGRFGTKIGLKNSEGKTVKVEYEALSKEDKEFVELIDYPEFTCDFLRNCDTVLFNSKTSTRANDLRPEEERCTYGARIKQVGRRDYPYELQVEFFALGRERIGDKFILLDRGNFTFSPSRKNNFMIEYENDRKVTLEDYYVQAQKRGEMNAGFLITVTDVRGEIIAMNASHDWLFENLENLRNLSIGNFFDRKCNRVFPTRPKHERR